MDEGRFYALLRFEEASLALRTSLHLNLVDRLENRILSHQQLTDEFGFTQQAGRTFFPLLQVMGILNRSDSGYEVSSVAASCLADSVTTSRKPYLAMGPSDDVDALIELMQGNVSAEGQPLYGTETGGPTLMDEESVAREIALGLASRARNFAGPLAECMAKRAINAKTLADVGAGSPYVADACLSSMEWLDKVVLVDRPNGMRFAREIAQANGLDLSQLEFCENDFFESVPPANVYVLSNTAHDWLAEEYCRIIENIGRVLEDPGMICIHEPILVTDWDSDSEWIHALWMACYALTLFRLTLGKGTCYTLREHCEILGKSGFELAGQPVPTSDGCTALFFHKA